MNAAAVQRLYVAYFNRPADPTGLAQYEAMLSSTEAATQAELEAIAETYFSPSAEYTANFDGLKRCCGSLGGGAVGAIKLQNHNHNIPLHLIRPCHTQSEFTADNYPPTLRAETPDISNSQI